MRKLRKRILIVLGINVAILLILYLGRRWFFESTIIDEAETAIAAALGVEVSIGAVHGNWLTSVVVDDIDIRGGADSAYRQLTDVHIELDYSLFSLISGDLRALSRLRIRAKRVELDTTKAWARPSKEPEPEAGAAPALAELVGMFHDGVRVEIDELVLVPEYVAPNPVTLTLNPGRERRDLTLVSGQTQVTGTITGTGEFTAKLTGSEAGRLLRAFGVEDAMSEGMFAANLRGSIENASLESDFDLQSKLKTGEVIHARYEIALKEGRLRAPTLKIDMPGISLSGNELDIPVENVSKQALASLFGSLKLEITNVLRYQSLLPEELRRYLPITGDLDLTLDKGVVKLRPSILKGKGFELRIRKGLLSLDESAQGIEKLREAQASGVGFELIVPDRLEIAIPGAGPMIVAGRLEATMSGSLREPNAQANFAFRDVQFEGYSAATLGGGITFAKKGEDPPHITLDLRCQVPSEVLSKANLSKDLIGKLTLPPVSLKADVRLPSTAKMPLGNVEIVLAGIAIEGLDPIDLSCKAALAERGVVRVDDLILRGEPGSWRAFGTIGLEDRSLDMTAQGKLSRLLPICRLVGLHDLDGTVELDKVTAKGSLTSLPDITVSGHAMLSTISPLWFGTGARHDVPEAPLDLTVSGSTSGAGFDLSELQLKWGKPDCRVTLSGGGPVPLKFTDRGLEAIKRDRPFAIELKASVERPRVLATMGRVDVDGKIELDSGEIRIPNLVTRSADGSFEARGLRAGVELGKVLDDSIRWPDVAIGGEIRLRELWLGRLADELIPKPEKPGAKPAQFGGAVSGDLTFGGRIGRPSLNGSITLKRGGISYPGAPKLEAIEGTARFDEKSIRVEYAARTTDPAPLTIVADIGSGTVPLWQAFDDKGAELSGNFRVEGLDLALLQESLKGLQGLHGKVKIDGKLRGTPEKLEPDITVTVRDAGWQLPDSAETIENLAVTGRLTRSEVTISECRGVVPSLNLKLSVGGGFKVEGGAALWEFVTDAQPQASGSFEFSEIPLGLLPRRGGLEAAKGIADGKLQLAGTWSNLRPTFNARIREAALKLQSLPRIEGLSAQLLANDSGATFEGDATMGAGPVAIRAKLTPGKQKAVLDAYAAGTIAATVKGDRLLLIRTGGLKLRGDVDLRAEGSLDKIRINGEVTLEDSKYVKRLSLVPDLKVTSGASTGDTFGPWALTGGDRLVFDIGLKTKDPVVLRTNVIDTDMDINCRLQGQGNSLTLSGACTSRTGTIRFPGMGMRISAMRLMFKGGAQPDILVIATGQRHGIRINMRLDGPIDDAVPKLSSSPALQPRDLWSLVTTGARPESLASNSAASNTAILATYVIQELVLTYLASESTEASQSFVSRFTFEFGREVSRDGAETWEVNFDIGELWYVPQRFGLRFERDVYEDYNLGLVYRWRF